MSSPSGRVHYHALDALRATAMLLGVVYHSLLFGEMMGGGPPAGFGPLSSSASRSLSGSLILQDWLHSFRMPMFFLISGFFCCMMWEKYGLWSYLARRWLRLGTALIVAIFTFVPLYQLAMSGSRGPGRMGGPPGRGAASLSPGDVLGGGIPGGLGMQLPAGLDVESLPPPPPGFVPPPLLEFDLDNDGSISSDEWETAKSTIKSRTSGTDAATLPKPQAGQELTNRPPLASLVPLFRVQLPGVPLPGIPLPAIPLPSIPLPGGASRGGQPPGGAAADRGLPGGGLPGGGLPGGGLPGGGLPGGGLPGGMPGFGAGQPSGPGGMPRGGPFGDPGPVSSWLFGDSVRMFTLNHLWFLWYLIIFATAAPLLATAAAWVWQLRPAYFQETTAKHSITAETPARNEQAVAVQSVWWQLSVQHFAPVMLGFICLPLLMWTTPFMGWKLGFAGGIGRGFPDFLWSLERDMPFYAAYFLAGWCLHAIPRSLEIVSRGCFINLMTGIAAHAAAMYLSNSYSTSVGNPNHWILKIAGFGLYSLGGALTTWGCLGLFQRFLNRPSVVGHYFAETAFWIYLLHQALLVPVLGWLGPFALAWWIKALLATTLTTVGCLVFYEAMVRATILRRLFGGGTPGERIVKTTSLSV